MESLVVLAVILVIVAPILAISAFVRAQRLADQFRILSLDKLADRLSVLERRLSAIERAISSGEPQIAAAPKPAPAPPAPVIPPPRSDLPAHPSIFAAPPLHASQPKTASTLDWETIIGGRWLNRIGIIALIIAVTFFLKYAFDNNWIGPRGRVAIGMILGASMLPWSQWLLRKGYSYFSEGIAGLGAAVMYLSIWAGCQYYTLFSHDVGFYAMIAITAGMAAVAVGRDSQRIALLSLVGGFLTPVLVSTGKDEQVVLFTYLLILGTGLLIIELRRDWRSLTPISFVFSQIYFWGWYSRFYQPDKLERTVVFATLFFVLYASLPILRAVRFSELKEVDIAVLFVNGAVYFGALHTMLWPRYRWSLTLLVLALSGAHLIIGRITPAPKAGESPVARLLFAGLALTFATLAIPIRLDGRWITMAFSVEGAVLICTGLRSKAAFLKGAGFLLLAIAAIRLLVFPSSAPLFLWNARFAAYAVLVACLAAVLYSARESAGSLGRNELQLFAGCAVALNVFTLIALSLELWDYFGRRPGMGIDSGLAQHLSRSLLWTSYASALIALGIHRKSALLRWQALALFGMVVVKVFIYDGSFLERFYRIVSFLILGLVLLLVSFLYQRKVTRERSSS